MKLHIRILVAILHIAILAGCTAVPSENVPETQPIHVDTVDETVAENKTEPETIAETVADSYPDAPYHYILTADAYPTLDFTYHADYMNFAICDFAILPNGNLLLLTMSDSVTELSPDGKIIGEYFYPFTASGKTAYRLAADADGYFYFLDGKNNAIHKADRDGIIRTIGIDKPDMAATSEFYALNDDVLVLGNYNDELVRSVFTFDVSGDRAELAEDVLPGILLSNGYRAEMKFLPDADDEVWDGSMTKRLSITLYNSDGTTVFSHVLTGKSADFAVMAGISPICMIEEETVLAKVMSFDINDQLCVSVVRIGKDGILGALTADPNPNDNLIHTFGGIAYIVRHPENGLEITPISELCTDFSMDCPYIITE